MVTSAIEAGAKGLVWMVVEDDGSLRSPVAKFLSEAETDGVLTILSASVGDTLLIAADDPTTVGNVLGQIRLDIGQPEGNDDLAFRTVRVTRSTSFVPLEMS